MRVFVYDAVGEGKVDALGGLGKWKFAPDWHFHGGAE